MSWDEQLQTASFRGVEFQVEALDDSLARRIQQYSYPWRDGADLDDLGREARRTTLTAVFTGPSYESDLGALMAVADAGKKGTFHHPTLGQWQARINIHRSEQNAARRDTAIVQVEVIEDGTSTRLLDLFSVESLAAQVDADADEVTAANTSAISNVAAAATEAKSWAASVKDNLDKATSAVNKVRAKVNTALKTVDTLTDFDNYPIVKSLRKLAFSSQQLADRVQKYRPTIKAREITNPTPLTLLAHQLYGDKDRAEQLLTLNPHIRNPFAVSGELKVHGE